MNAKKIIFLLFVLISFILLYYYIDVLNNRESAKCLKRFFDVSSLEKIKSKYTQVETLAVDGSSYTSICIPSTQKVLPNGIILIKMPSGKTRVFYGGYYFQHCFLHSLAQYAKIIIEEDPEYIIEQKKILNFENAMEVSLDIFTKNNHFSEL